MARVTTVICSINSNTGESPTIDSVSWSADNGTLTLAAPVPAGVKVGDIISDNASNTYLITGISGSDLICQDFDTTADPITGAAAINEAFVSITAWEATLDDSPLYASGDDAEGHLFGAVDEAVTINGGAGVGLNSIKLTGTSDKHDGTAGTGAGFVQTADVRNLTCSNSIAITIEWIEFDCGQNRCYILMNGMTAGVISDLHHNLLHGFVGTAGGVQFVDADARDILFHNNFVFDYTRSTTSTGIAVTIDADRAGGGVFNNTIADVNNPNATGNAIGLQIFSDDADGSVRNNMSIGAVVGGSGTASCFTFVGSTNLTSSNNLSSDDTADDGGGSGHQLSKTPASQVVDHDGPSYDLHLLNASADAFETGVDLVTTPTGVNIDIDGFDRNAGATTWSMGAHDGNNLRGAAPYPWYTRRHAQISHNALIGR